MECLSQERRQIRSFGRCRNSHRCRTRNEFASTQCPTIHWKSTSTHICAAATCTRASACFAWYELSTRSVTSATAHDPLLPVYSVWFGLTVKDVRTSRSGMWAHRGSTHFDGTVRRDRNVCAGSWASSHSLSPLASCCIRRRDGISE